MHLNLAISRTQSFSFLITLSHLHEILVAAALPTFTAASGLTWPLQYDEFEEVMFLQAGYARCGLVDGVNPCSTVAGGTQSSAWVRTVFHDMITHDGETGTGGLDASLLFEMDRLENAGALSFNETYGFLMNSYSSELSMADLTALGMYVAIANCGEAGPSGVPEPTHDTETMVARFAKAGMNVTEMVTCGHSLGGIHGNDFPQITGPGHQNDTDFLLFDSTGTNFDNNVITSYLVGNTSNLLVVGLEETNSDKRAFCELLQAI
ncbi:hypothetical protein VKT23_015584 [Stygiomarasmius scandens]|uniref:Peroxidase n=1 Tax=Marasmiellus scandens TaxID=2682957 RepID=A0ABR1J079_9AGAR